MKVAWKGRGGETRRRRTGRTGRRVNKMI